MSCGFSGRAQNPSPLWGGAAVGVRSEAARRPSDGTPHPTLPHKGGGKAPLL